MNATERGRRSDSLYYGEVTRRGLCDMLAASIARVGELERENEILRKRCAGKGGEHGRQA